MDYKFNKNTIEHLGHYVYALIDPKDNTIFYVGKGTGNRVFAHVNAVLKGKFSKITPKIEKIEEIHKRTDDSINKVKHCILHHGMTNEHALFIESVLIDLLHHNTQFNLQNSDLANIQSGYDCNRGIRTAEALAQFYNADETQFMPNEKVLALNISKTDGDIDERIRRYWVVDIAKASQADYILASYKGFVVGVYKDVKWSPVGKKYEFEHTRVCNGEFYDRVFHKKLPQRKGGQQNPVWYIHGWNTKEEGKRPPKLMIKSTTNK